MPSYQSEGRTRPKNQQLKASVIVGKWAILVSAKHQRSLPGCWLTAGKQVGVQVLFGLGIWQVEQRTKNLPKTETKRKQRQENLVEKNPDLQRVKEILLGTDHRSPVFTSYGLLHGVVL